MQIAFYQAHYNSGAVSALRLLAMEVGAPIDDERIATWKRIYSQAGDSSTTFRNTSDYGTLRNDTTVVQAHEVTP